MQDRTFRSLPPEVEPIAANRALTTMDFFEFADAGDSDGVFWGSQTERSSPPPAVTARLSQSKPPSLTPGPDHHLPGEG